MFFFLEMVSWISDYYKYNNIMLSTEGAKPFGIKTNKNYLEHIAYENGYIFLYNCWFLWDEWLCKYNEIKYLITILNTWHSTILS